MEKVDRNGKMDGVVESKEGTVPGNPGWERGLQIYGIRELV